MPPSRRPKSRYLNVESLVPWARKFEDFSAFSPFFKLEIHQLNELSRTLDNTTITRLKSLVNKTYASQQSFCTALSFLEPPLNDKEKQIILEMVSVGPKELVEKLGWLEEYQPALKLYSQMLDLVHLAEKQLKRHGLNRKSKARFLTETKHLKLVPRLQKFKNSITNYFRIEGAKIPRNQVLYSSSDVLESIFGKYKIFSGEIPTPEVNELVLTIPLCTVKITGSFVKEAMENVRMRDVDRWVNHYFGQSTLSRKRAFFGSH